uniref:Uncharacterized protein n=1 Tax=Anguilla anguilla TaxID=7936 RepID=A0A0E9Q7N0_ANGAN
MPKRLWESFGVWERLSKRGLHSTPNSSPRTGQEALISSPVFQTFVSDTTGNPI